LLAELFQFLGEIHRVLEMDSRDGEEMLWMEKDFVLRRFYDINDGLGRR
tara:strand:+ start:564 stop:710 length:147 start_codon:yes stop_codon:yes gene_type:complete